MNRVWNFSAGPAVLPQEVLARAGDEMLDWHGSGMGVMEMSHRGKEFMGIAAETEKDLREILSIPAGYKVLFLAGGATLQFAAIPLNLLGAGSKADYVVTGEWSKKAAKEAKALRRMHPTPKKKKKSAPAAKPAPRPVAAAPPRATAAASVSSTLGMTPAINPANGPPLQFYVQAGAYARPDDADAQRARVAMLGMAARVMAREQAGRTVYRVRVGPFDERSSAEDSQARLGAAGIEANLVRVER